MNILLLPGNSPRHKSWAEDLKLSLLSTTNVGSVIAQHYTHWRNGEEFADTDHELLIATASARELDTYLIIAKSIGIAIALEGTTQGKLQPKQLILLGIPINGTIAPETYRDWLKGVTVPTIIMQNTNDPYGSFAELQALIEPGRQNISLIETEGDTHDYLDFDTIGKCIL